jgi:aryl-alcohol dehydrogenase-like predicted oxidoreductase
MKPQRLNRRNFLASSSLGLMGSAGLINTKFFQPENAGRPLNDIRIKEYRILGRTGFKASDIGCGPALITNENLLKAVINAGVNCFDTAEFYGNGNNELMVGKAIRDFERDSLFINTKLRVTGNDTKDDILARAQKCLERLDTPYLDGVMLWNADSVNLLKNEAFHQAVKQLKSEGKAKFCGVSYHGAFWYDTPKESMEEVLVTAAEDGRFDLVLLVYNFVQRQMGENILNACKKNNVGTTLMKTQPFGGYQLDMFEQIEASKKEGKPVSEREQIFYDKRKQEREEAEPFLQKYQLTSAASRRDASIRFILDNPDAHSILISFRNFEEIADYVQLSGTHLTAGDHSTINLLRETYSSVYCRHACGLCETKCPYRVPVNAIMRYNYYFMGQAKEKFAIQKYKEIPGNKASECQDCEGFCEKACPYGVKIQALLSIAHKNLSLA